MTGVQPGDATASLCACSARTRSFPPAAHTRGRGRRPLLSSPLGLWALTEADVGGGLAVSGVVGGWPRHLAFAGGQRAEGRLSLEAGTSWSGARCVGLLSTRHGDTGTASGASASDVRPPGHTPPPLAPSQGRALPPETWPGTWPSLCDPCHPQALGHIAVAARPAVGALAPSKAVSVPRTRSHAWLCLGDALPSASGPGPADHPAEQPGGLSPPSPVHPLRQTTPRAHLLPPLRSPRSGVRQRQLPGGRPQVGPGLGGGSPGPGSDPAGGSSPCGEQRGGSETLPPRGGMLGVGVGGGTPRGR